MHKKLAEETILFISVLKWVFLASLIGVIVGSSTTVFLKALTWTTAFTHQLPLYFLLLPVGLFFSALLTKYLAPDAEGHGTEKVIEAVHKQSGRINVAVIPVKLFSTIITLATGGSAGKEGPCAQIGAGLSSLFADLVRFNDLERKKLVICGISAGFASVFGTPIAGAIFGVEVLFAGSILYDVLLPSFVSGIIAHQVSSFFGVTYFYHPLNFNYVFNEFLFLKIVAAGILLGLCSLLFIEILNLGKRISENVKVWEPLKGLYAGIFLIALTFICSKQFLGLGLETIKDSLTGENIVWYAFFLKMVFTAITLGFGGSGGVITPILFIGSAAGNCFAPLLGLDKSTAAAVGLVGLLAGAANTPIAASIMAVELFGPKIAPYAAIACVISFLISGHRSVYPSQILSIRKSSSVYIDVGKEVEGIIVQVQPRSKTVSSGMFKMIRIIKKTFYKKID